MKLSADKCIAVTTITIDIEAYDALARQKKPGQSSSQVIKAQFGPRKTLAAFRRTLRATVVSEHTLNAVAHVVQSRKKSAPSVPTL